MQAVFEVAAESGSLRTDHARRGRRTDSAEALLSRLLAPLAKLWICKRTPSLLAELPECFGGNGYVEEGLLAPLNREAPHDAIQVVSVEPYNLNGSTIVIFACRIAVYGR